MDKIDHIRDGLSASMMTEQGVDGARASSPLPQFQQEMLTEVMEGLRELCPITCVLNSSPCWLVKASEEVLDYGDCQHLSWR